MFNFEKLSHDPISFHLKVTGLTRISFVFSRTENSIEIAAELISKGHILTTYIDKTETGPRALGNTSIICNAKDKLAVENLNNRIKKREFYQPLAPMLLKEKFERYFSIQNSIKKNLYSMGTLCEAKEELKNDYLAVIHNDNTYRAQVIDNENSFIFKLLKKLDDNNINILVNTSFNISKDPMVFDLFDVYTNMRRMNIEYVIMNDGIFKAKEI